MRLNKNKIGENGVDIWRKNCSPPAHNLKFGHRTRTAHAGCAELLFLPINAPYTRIRKFSNTVFRVEIFEYAANSYPHYPFQPFPVEINQHGISRLSLATC